MAYKINAKELREKLEEYVIIDVREADELSEGKIDGSIHMPLGLTIKKAKKGMIDELKGKKICTHCSTGYRGDIAADELNKWGFQAVTLEGGFAGWKQHQ